MDDRRSPPPLSPPDLAIKQQARVRQYLATALDDPDPLRANAAALSCDLMELAHRLKKGLDDAVDAGLHAFNDFDKLAPVLNAYLRMTRQIQSFAQLDCQLANSAETRPHREPPPARNRSAPPASEESGV